MDRSKAIADLDFLRERGVSDASMLEHIIYRYLSGDDACRVTEDLKEENGLDDIEE